MEQEAKQLTIAIIDYGMGNIQSVSNALELLHCEPRILDEPEGLIDVDAIVLPGVGAFGEAMKNLKKLGLIGPLRKAVLDGGKPLLGICLGMQLLAEGSEEYGQHTGLSFIPGLVRAIPISNNLRLPHIGWNEIIVRHKDPLFHDIKNKGAFYFVHSYRFECDPVYIAGTTNYGSDIIAAVQYKHIFGVQFHPERSQQKGLRLLHNFLNFVESTQTN